MATTDLTRALYSGMDFDTYIDDLRARLQVQYAADYNDFSTSALGMLLLDQTSYGLDTLSFYLDRRATDSYLVTSRTRKSISRLTRQLGYKMRAAVASSVDLSTTIASPGFDVPVKKGFQFAGPNQLIFEAAQDVTWLSGDSIRTKIVPCYEGQTLQETFTSDGSANQVFTLRRVPDKHFIASGSVVVLVNGYSWDEVEFISFDKTNQFECGYNDDPATIRFGDGISGNIPPSTASIVVTYIACRGKDGLVTEGTIVKEQNPLVVNFQTITMTVTNPLGSVGGDDPEDLDHAKTYAAKVWKSRYVAVTQEDYEALAGSFADPLYGRVAVAQAISSRSAESDTDLTNNITAIQRVIDDPLPIAGSAVQLSGTASIAVDGTLNGIGTKFVDDLATGNWIKVGTDQYRQITSITTDVVATVTPVPGTLIPSDVIYRYGASIVQAQSRLVEIHNHLLNIVTYLTDIGSTNTDINTLLTTLLTGLRSIKNDAGEAQTTASGLTSDLTMLQVDANYGIDNWGASLLAVGSGTAAVWYSAKIAGATIQHTIAAGSVIVSVAGYSVTVTFPAGTTAAAVAAAVNADPNASVILTALLDTVGSGSAVSQTSIAVPGVVAVEAVKANAKVKLTESQAKATALSSLSSTLVSSATASITTEGQIADKLLLVGLTTGDGLLADITTEEAAADTLLGDTSALVLVSSTGTLNQDLIDIQTVVVSTSATITTALQNIYNHVDLLLSADCKANLVTVSILARDKSGFFATPSYGLIHAVQTFLDARKEVTQNVQVTSGAETLVRAVVRARIGVLPSYAESVTKTAVETAIDGVLRDRKFGESLYLSELSIAVNALAGVGFSNITLVGPAANLDGDGNLLVDTAHVITKGQVTVSTEVYVSV